MFNRCPVNIQKEGVAVEKTDKTTISTDGSSKSKIKRTAILFMGLSHILYLKQKGKGICFAAIELIFIFFTFITTICFPNMYSIIYSISDMFTWGYSGGVLVNSDPHNFILIQGVMACVLVILFFVAYYISVHSALEAYKTYCISGRFEAKSTPFQVVDRAFPMAALTPALALVLFFVVVPLIFSFLVAFTDYTSINQSTFSWVGGDNFATMFGGDAQWTSALVRVVVWTLIWALLATVTCYGGGLIVAVLLTDKKIKIAPVFRTIFILPYAVPSIVSMRVWYSLLNGSSGIINRTLEQIGFNGFLRGLNIIGGSSSFFGTDMLPWLSDGNVAKFVCIIINLWAGFPYFMLLSMGTMTSISADVNEAARIDGASKFQIFRRITLPLVLYQTMPLIIMSFVHNINNFGAIFYLTGGYPNAADTATTYAKGTDIIVSWIYTLTVTQGKYMYASVLAILVFVVLCPIAIWNFRRTKSFKEGDV